MNVHDIFPSANTDGFNREIVLSTHDHGELRQDTIDAGELVFFDKYTRRSVLLKNIPFENMNIPLNVIRRIGPHYSQAQVAFDYLPNRLEKSISFLGLKIVLFKSNTPAFTTIEYDDGVFSIEFHDSGLLGVNQHPEKIPEINLDTVIDLLYGLATPGTAKFEGPTLDSLKRKSPSAALEVLVEMLGSLASFKQTTDEVEHEFSASTNFSAYAGLKKQVTETKRLNPEGKPLTTLERMYSVFSKEKFDIDSRENNRTEIIRTLSYAFYPDSPKEFNVFEQAGTDLDDFGTSAELTILASIKDPSPDDEQWLREIQQREILASEKGFKDRLVGVLGKMARGTKR